MTWVINQSFSDQSYILIFLINVCLDDEWLTDWYGYKQPMTAMRSKPYDERVSFKEELEEFNKLNQINKLNQKPSHVS